MGHHPPGAAAPHDVENGVEEKAGGVTGRSPESSRGKRRLQEGPFFVS